MVKVYRICKTKYIAAAFDGEGAFKFGGRWNSRGKRLVYVAESISLAILEMIVHFQDQSLISSYSYIEATFDKSLVVSISSSKLPKNWQESPPPYKVQKLGDEWAKNIASAVLQIPSAIIPSESNYLINPNHEDFVKISIGKPQNLAFDERLLKKK
jgi:RES domain-containing protein